MGKKPEDTEENQRLETILGNNIRRISEMYAGSHAKFYLQYLDPMRSDQSETEINEAQREAFRQRMVRLIRGQQQPTLEELKTLSDLAGVSINELITEEIDVDRCMANTRDVLYTLYNLLDNMWLSTKEIEIDGEKKFAIYPSLAHPEDIEANSKQIMKFYMGHFINEFLREYTAHKPLETANGRKATNVDNYKLWRRRVLEGAFAFMVDGQEYQNREPNEEAKAIADRANEAIDKASKKWRDEVWPDVVEPITIVLKK